MSPPPAPAPTILWPSAPAQPTEPAPAPAVDSAAQPPEPPPAVDPPAADANAAPPADTQSADAPSGNVNSSPPPAPARPSAAERAPALGDAGLHLPAVANLEEPLDFPGVGLIQGKPRELDARRLLVFSAGFGGHSVAALIERDEGGYGLDWQP